MSIKIGIFGAGSIGCYVGGRLAANGEDVVFLGRERLAKTIRETGLRLTHFDRAEAMARPVQFETDPKTLGDCDIIIVTVKSQDTQTAGKTLVKAASSKAVIVSLQNGIGNEVTLKNEMPDHDVYAAMVPNNVVNLGGGHFHMGTEGDITLQDAPALKSLKARMIAASIATTSASDMTAVQWGKLILNLNNPINALCGVTLVEELGQKDNRLVLAACIRETLAVLDAANITPAQVGKVPPEKLAKLLSLPNFLYRQVMKRAIKIDPKARSSMWEDLTGGRASEIDHISGAVTRLGQKHGVPTPYNDTIVRLTHEAFANGESPNYSGKTLKALCES